MKRFVNEKLWFYDSVSIMSPQLRFVSICCVSKSWKFVVLSSPFETFLMLPLLCFWASFMRSPLRGLDEKRAGDFWPSLVPFDFGFGLMLLFCKLAVNSNIIAFSATDPDEFELPPSKRNTLSDDEYLDNGVGVSSWFAGTAKLSRIRIDAKFTSWSIQMSTRMKRTKTHWKWKKMTQQFVESFS